jgi:pyruvate/2-oxoglutarate/acetoin dehydrogenase E1 component
MTRILKYSEALNEALAQCLEFDENVYVIGLGAPDPKGIFGSTIGLRKKFGADRVFDMPISENAVTGMAIGSAITGMRPILVHQRIDFAITAMEQMVNQAAKWHFMFGGQSSVPIVIRMIVGRGWGQGPQHSQSLQAMFAHVPGLKVVMPATAYDAKGLLVASVEDNNPVLFIEHRWLYGLESVVPEEKYSEPLWKCKVVRDGDDITIVSLSYMTIDALQAADILSAHDISAEIVDIRTVSPLDWDAIFQSVSKTGRLLVADTGTASFGVSGEVIAKCSEKLFDKMIVSPTRIALPDSPSPTSSSLANKYFPRAGDIAELALSSFGKELDQKWRKESEPKYLDIPDPSFTGPF